MTAIKINMNDDIKVRFTQKGYEILATYHPWLNCDASYYKSRADDNGYYKIRFCDFLQIASSMGYDITDTGILVEPSDLERLGNNGTRHNSI